MTDSQKDRIRELRNAGFSYAAIADAVSLNSEAVRSFCRYNGIVSNRDYGIRRMPKDVCRHCGKPLQIIEGKRKKEFCSTACRAVYWREHNHPTQQFTCRNCGKQFYSFQSKNPVYCSIHCYMEARFGSRQDDI